MNSRLHRPPATGILLAAIAWLAATPALADEGAWLLDDLPRETLQGGTHSCPMRHGWKTSG